MKWKCIILLFLGLDTSNLVSAESTSQTKVTLQSFYFFEDADLSVEDDSAVSISIEPSYQYSWDLGKKVFNTKLFYRADANDSERSHFDIRELSWTQQIRQFEYKIGISKEFWGVVESYRLIDVINQADFAEDIFFRERLGQPMAKLSYLSDYGSFSAWVLPWFRERTYTSEKSRIFLGNTDVDEDNPLYAHADEEKHVDFAFRYGISYGAFDVGLSYYQGTERTPELIFDATTAKLTPYYDQVKTLSTDVQWTGDALLLKLEALQRNPQNSTSSYAAVYGFEYTFYGVIKSHDLGVLVEELYDERGKALTSFDNDTFAGVRYTLNDIASTEILAGVIVDNENAGQAYRLEISTRINQNFSISLESQIFHDIDDNDLFFYDIRDDNYIMANLEFYF